jgi:hypothetical protein
MKESMIRRKSLATAAAVLSISMAIGVPTGLALRSAKAQWSARAQRPAHPLRIGSEFGFAHPNPALDKNGRHLEGYKANLGGPGVLLVRATYQVGQPYHQEKDVPYDVLVTVVDNNTGKTIISEDYIGSSVHPAGGGGWQQNFSASYALPPGEYGVDVLAHDPTRKEANTSIIKDRWVVGYFRRSLTVQ